MWPSLQDAAKLEFSQGPVELMDEVGWLQLQLARVSHLLVCQVWGFSSFRQGQEETVERVLAGKCTLLIQATGTGKSLCYQVQSRNCCFVCPVLCLSATCQHEVLTCAVYFSCRR